MRLLFCSLAFILFFSSCNTFDEPTLEGIENVELEEINTKRLKIKADMLIHNPNPFALDLAEADLSATVEEIQLAIIQQTFDTEMPANQNFRMPVVIDMDLTKLYKDDPLAAISKGLKIINEKRICVHFKGNIKVGKGNAKVPIPIDQLEEVKF